MGEIAHVVRRLILTATLCICAYMYYNVNQESKFDAYGTIYVTNEYVDTYYEPITDNTGYTTINGISNVFINMKALGYTVYKTDITNNQIDVVFKHDELPTYRYYFTYPDGKVTIISSEYESSYKGVTYIISKVEGAV